MISIYDIIINNILYLESGNIISIDNIFINGHEIKYNEFSATGKSD
jgi:P-type Ca2+ transporter type 2C